MPYSADIVKMARQSLAEQKADKESQYRQNLYEAYTKLPRLKELDKQLRLSMTLAADFFNMSICPGGRPDLLAFEIALPSSPRRRVSSGQFSTQLPQPMHRLRSKTCFPSKTTWAWQTSVQARQPWHLFS